jgi:isoleucyl-tRNA synthetase
MADTKELGTKVSFKDTLNLPHTDFPIRANGQEQDPAMIQRWTEENLFKKSFDHNQGDTKFVLHDGPPYANGHIHMGHAVNKVLKDFITKSKRMFGNHVPCTPGWDCHGLPIEFKVSQENPGLSRSELKKACRAYASKWIDVQREEFKKLGVLMDWDNPYLTMNFNYEADTLQAFASFVADNYIERKNKTVPWCIHCQTVLATAEIEYEERKDPSLYVQFPLEQKLIERVFPAIKSHNVGILIWTTTPWTLPLNRAVMVKPHEQYQVLDVNGKYILVGAQLADKVCATLGVEKVIVAECNSDDLLWANGHAQHPFQASRLVPIVADVSVDMNEGTAAVHTAPGAGPQDYEVGIKNDLEIYSPVSPDGTYTNEIEPKELVGMSIKDAQSWVITKLIESGLLIHKTSIKHSFPHCWRCHNPLIFRATKQWFFDLEKGGVRNKALQAITQLDMYPEVGRNRLSATIEGRLEWCISRQRVWGVPIPALLCTECDYTHITQEFVDTIAHRVAESGIEYWDDVSVESLIPDNFTCPSCNGHSWRKETDILDVWFDSGVSHYAVLKQRPELRFPADMYAEGKDQHRGWFQSSLLTSIALNKQAPMHAILTHGFTVDAKGRKMSKSLGNVVSPQEIIDQLGTDGLRMWVASVDYVGDLVISDVLLRNVQEVFRKIRNTCRFLLSNLYDFDIAKDAIPFEQLSLIDQHALIDLFQLNHAILERYKAYDFTAVVHQLGDYCAVDLSSFYLDVIKDRLYVEKADGLLRRSTQTACWYILDTLTKLMAPILSFTAEQISDHYQKNKTQSIHLQNFADLKAVEDFIAHKSMPWVAVKDQILMGDAHAAKGSIAYFAQQKERWDLLKTIRSAILKSIEQKRAAGIIKHSLEAHVFICFDSLDEEKRTVLKNFFADLDRSGQGAINFFKEFTIVSQCTITHKTDGLDESIMPGLYIAVDGAQGHKCPRCWQWEVSEHEHNLCSRCQRVLSA